MCPSCMCLLGTFIYIPSKYVSNRSFELKKKENDIEFKTNSKASGISALVSQLIPTHYIF